MATYFWGVPPGVTGTFDDKNNWVDADTKALGVAVPGPVDTANTVAPAHLVIAAGTVHTISKLQVLSQLKDEDFVRIDGSLTVTQEVFFENDRGNLRFTGVFALDGATMDVDLMHIGGPPPVSAHNAVGVDDEGTLEVIDGAIVTTRRLEISGTGGLAIANGGKVDVAGPVVIQQDVIGSTISVSGTGSALLVDGNLSLDGSLQFSQGAHGGAQSATVSSINGASLVVGDFDDPNVISMFTADDLTLGDVLGGAGSLAVLPNGQVFVDHSLTMLDAGTFAVELITLDGGFVEIGGNGGAAPDSVQIDSDGATLGLVGRGMVQTTTFRNDGLVGAQGGRLFIVADVIGSGTFHVSDNAALEIDGKVGSSATVALDGIAASLTLDRADAFSGMIAAFDFGDTIQLNNTGTAFGNAVVSAVMTIDSSGQHFLSLMQNGAPLPLSFRIGASASLAGSRIEIVESADQKSTSLGLTAQGTIVSIAPLSAVQAEGHSGSTFYTFTASLTQASATVQTVHWAVTGSGADPANTADFAGGVLPAGTVTFAAGETSKVVTVAVAGDVTIEPDEGFTIGLSNPSSGLAIGTAAVTGTIQNDDASVSVAAVSAAKAEGNGATTPFTFTVSLTGDTSVAHSVSWAVTGSGSEQADGQDFAGGALPSGIVTFAVGETTKTITLEVVGDSDVEADEGFQVNLSNPTSGLTIGSGSAAGTVFNDDASVSVAALSAVKAEGNSGTTPFTFTVTRTGDLAVAHSVSWSIVGSGVDGADPSDIGGTALNGGTLSFTAGETTRTILVEVFGDTEVEFDEEFTVSLFNPTVGLIVGTSSAIGMIQDDDRSTVSIAALSAAKAEESSGTTPFTFTVTLDQAGVTAQTVAWAATGSAPNAADAADFGGILPSGTVTFAASETSRIITLPVSGDTIVEPDNFFTVTLSSPSAGLSLGSASAVGIVQNDDRATVSIAALAAVKPEGNGGTTSFTFTVSLDQASFEGQTANWTVTEAGVNPANAADFGTLPSGTLPSGTVTFAPGETSKTVTVNVAGDTTLESDEGFVVSLSGLSLGLTIGTSSATGTIQNDDNANSIASFATTNLMKAEGHSGTIVFEFIVTLDHASSSAQSIDWSVVGSDINPAILSDFRGTSLPSGTLVFSAGETSKTIGVLVHGDTTIEPDEDFTVKLSNPSPAITLGENIAFGTIVNEDAEVTIEAATSPTKLEGNAGLSSLGFLMTRSGDLSVSHVVSYAVAGSGANPASSADFVGGALPAGAVTFSPGETSKTIVVNIQGDTVVEADESFEVALSMPSPGLSIAMGYGTTVGTILNDDIAVVTHDDAYIVLEGQSLSSGTAAGVLVNDQSASSATQLTGTSHGTLQLDGTGGFTYSPAAGFSGIDFFTYHAVPGGNGVDGKASLYVVPVNVGASTTLDLLALSADEQIAATYAAFFGRAADSAGHSFWVGQFNTGLPVQGPAALFANIASSFGISEEAKALYPFLANPFGASDGQISAFLDSVYGNLFNRGSDAAGLAYWTGQTKATLQAGQFVGSILVNIMGGAQDTAAGKDITTLMGKVAVSLEYVREQQEHDAPWRGPSDVAAATALLETVTADPASVLVGIRNAETLVGAQA